MPRSITIGGKQYVTVAEKVKEAHGEHGYTMAESGPIEVHGRYFWRVAILVPTDDGQQQQFIGTAEIKFDNAKPGTADATNPLECAETSALGRALSFAGYGVVDGIASADEVTRGGYPSQNAAPRPVQPAGAAFPPGTPTAAPQRTPAASQGQERHSGPLGQSQGGDEPASQQQLDSLEKLRVLLDKPFVVITSRAQAGRLIVEYSAEYQRLRQQGNGASDPLVAATSQGTRPN